MTAFIIIIITQDKDKTRVTLSGFAYATFPLCHSFRFKSDKETLPQPFTLFRPRVPHLEVALLIQRVTQERVLLSDQRDTPSIHPS